MNPDASGDHFDDFATAAGAALRRPAPDNGLAGVRSSLRRRRISQVAGAGGAAVIVFAAGALLLATNQDDSQLRVVPADDIVPTSPDPRADDNSRRCTGDLSVLGSAWHRVRFDRFWPACLGLRRSCRRRSVTPDQYRRPPPTTSRHIFTEIQRPRHRHRTSLRF